LERDPLRMRRRMDGELLAVAGLGNRVGYRRPRHPRTWWGRWRLGGRGWRLWGPLAAIMLPRRIVLYSRTYTKHLETARKRETFAGYKPPPKRKHSHPPAMSGSPVPRSPLIVNRPASDRALLTDATSNVSRSVGCGLSRSPMDTIINKLPAGRDAVY